MGETHSALYTVVIRWGVLQSYSPARNRSLIEPLKSRPLVFHHCQGSGGHPVGDTGMGLAMCFCTICRIFILTTTQSHTPPE